MNGEVHETLSCQRFAEFPPRANPVAEKGLDVELVPVDLGAKEQFSDAYRAINPA